MKQITRRWIDKAEGDFKVSIRESTFKDTVDDIICFHAQQCIEKYLKAILVENGIRSPKVHDLKILLSKTLKFSHNLSRFKNDFTWLTDFSVISRYPVYDATSKDSEKAVRIIRKARKEIRKYFGL